MTKGAAEGSNLYRLRRCRKFVGNARRLKAAVLKFAVSFHRQPNAAARGYCLSRRFCEVCESGGRRRTRARFGAAETGNAAAVAAAYAVRRSRAAARARRPVRLNKRSPYQIYQKT